MKIVRPLRVVLGCLIIALAARAGDVRVIRDLSYKTEQSLSEYERERCKLDLYLPVGAPGLPVLVWAHGGGLTGGHKDDVSEFARHFATRGLAVVAINYRLSPKAKYPAYLDDTASAFAWVRTHAAEYGLDPQRVFLGGHSAGGYLTLMVGLDPQYLQHHGLRLTDVAGLVPVSGQTMTHYTVREERGLPKDVVIADAAAPVHHARKDAPPLLVAWADGDLPARGEENQYLIALLRAAGATRVEPLVVAQRDHGTIVGEVTKSDDPLSAAILRLTSARAK